MADGSRGDVGEKDPLPWCWGRSRLGTGGGAAMSEYLTELQQVPSAILS